MKNTYKRSWFLPHHRILLLTFAALLTSSAYAFDTSTISGRTLRGNDADHSNIGCSMELTSIRKSPSNKRFRKMTYSFHGSDQKMIDFDPKSDLMPVYYNPKGWYGYEIWFRSYGDDSHYLRIWMDAFTPTKTPVSLQLYSESKKTGLKRLMSDCVNIK